MTNEYASPEDRIRLAEFMGWKRLADDPDHPKYDEWFPPNNWKRSASTPLTYHTLGLPDPLNDHTDCHALRDALQRAGYDIEVWWSGTAYEHRSNVNCRVKMKYRSDWSPRPPEGEAFDDYRTGVVTLALDVVP